MTLTGMKKHVQVLEDARLVKTQRVGRVRTCTLGTRQPGAEAARIEKLRDTMNARLNRLPFSSSGSSTPRATGCAAPTPIPNSLPSGGDVATSSTSSATSSDAADGMPAHVIIESLEFEDLGDGRTKITNTMAFHTPEERDGMLNSGMEGGMNASFVALDALLEKQS